MQKRNFMRLLKMNLHVYMYLYYTAIICLTVQLKADEIRCSISSPCIDGSCCSGSGVCGRKPEFCGKGCISNCKCPAEAPNNQFIDSCSSNNDCLRIRKGNTCCIYCSKNNSCHGYCHDADNAIKEPDCALYGGDFKGLRFGLMKDTINDNLNSSHYKFKSVELKQNCKLKMCYEIDNEPLCSHVSQKLTFTNPKTNIKSLYCHCKEINQIKIHESCARAPRAGRLTIRFRIKPLPLSVNSIHLYAGRFTFIITDHSVKLENDNFFRMTTVNRKNPDLKFLHFNATENSIWLSVYALDRNFADNFIKIGMGYIYQVNTIFDFRTQSSDTIGSMKLIKNVTIDENAETLEKVCDDIPVVKDRAHLLYETIPISRLNENLMTPAELPNEGLRLYNIINSHGLSLEEDAANAINYSIDHEGCLLNELLKKKSTFGVSDKRTSYIRVTFDYVDGRAPGQPYVLEIWPMGHSSPVHNHGGSVAVIKMLHGHLKSEWYNPLAEINNEIPKVVKTGYLNKDDITWMTPCYYQTHRLHNINESTAAISIQAYSHVSYVEDHSESFNYVLPHDGKLKYFKPNSDYKYDELMPMVLNEYRTNTFSNQQWRSCQCNFDGLMCGSTIHSALKCVVNIDRKAVYSCNKSNGVFVIIKKCLEFCSQGDKSSAECGERKKAFVNIIPGKSSNSTGVLVMYETEIADLNLVGIVNGLSENEFYELQIHEWGDITNECRDLGQYFSPFMVGEFSESKLVFENFDKIKADKDGTAFVNVSTLTINLKPGNMFNVMHRSISIQKYKNVSSQMNHTSSTIIACGKITSDIKMETKTTLLNAASRYGLKEVVELLLSKNAKIDEKDKYGSTALMEASTYGHKEVVEFLLFKNAKIDEKDNNGWTAFMWASSSGHKEVVELLLSKNAKIDEKDNNGWTAFMWASTYGHKEVVEFLLSKNAKIDEKDNNGRTALMWSSISGHKEVVELLLSKNAKIDEKDKYGRTALMFASISGHKEVVELLLSKNAKIDEKDNNGRTAFMWASTYGHKEVFVLFLFKNANI